MDLSLLQSLGTALFIGALVGIERLQHQQSEASSFAGIRTFMLFAVFGALCGWLSKGHNTLVPFEVGLGCTAALATAAYLVQQRVREDSAGITTVVATLIVYTLGGITLLGNAALAVALGIITAALLALKKPLHEAVGRIRREELLATLRLLFASFIVLQLLPDRTIDPWGALNPFKLWWLVILISALSMVGYVAVRIWGSARGTIITGLFGGLVSSTAVTLTFARQSHDDASNEDAFGAGTLLAWAVMILRVIVLTALLGWPLMAHLWWPLLGLGAFNTAMAIVYTRRTSLKIAPSTLPQPVAITNPSNGVVLSAPAAMALAATAADSDGNIANVKFFQGTTSLATVTSSPYSVAVSNLAAGDYTFSAVATDNGGLSATNAIAVHVVTPVPVVLSGLQRPSPTSFQFNHSASVGLRYVVQRSSDLTSFTPINTNTAASNPVTFFDSGATGRLSYYRVRLLPNP